MNRHRHSRCHYNWNSGSAPAGMNNLHTGEPAGQQAPGDSPASSAAAAMVPGRTLQLEGSRSRPHSRDVNQTLKPKSQRPGARMVAVIPSATRTSSAITTSAPTTEAICPPADPHSDPPGRANTNLRAEAPYWGKGRTAHEHERRPSSARRLGRSSGARGATTAHTAGGGTGSRARAN
jgi:hypothetical protein